MKLFPQDNAVDLYKTGFEDDILDRTPISKQMSELVERIEDPMVLALDDKWGSGKTFFLKRWVAAHTLENGGTARTVYFDAFEHDYLSDPLVSIISAVTERLSDQAATVKKWKTVATKLAKPAFKVALSALTFGATQQLGEMGDVIAHEVSGEAKDAAKDLWDVEKGRKAAMSEFREILSELTKETNAPIVIVVDELDRCRPDYALSVLEIIKHFFSVPKVHFILGVNGKALENSVKARYGSEIDAESYLRKFINVSFSLPRVIGERGENSALLKYAEQLISDMGLPEKVSYRCVHLLRYVEHSRDVSLRDVGKILSKVALVPDAVHERNFLQGRIDMLCALIVTSIVDPQLHSKLVFGNAETSELREYLGASKEKTIEVIEDEYNSAYDRHVAFWLATLVFCCGNEEIEDVASLDPKPHRIECEFDRFGVNDRKSIAPQIQKDWVEIFRI